MPVVLVGTYRSVQMKKWILPKGYYNYPVSDEDDCSPEHCAAIKELWLYNGKTERKVFEAKFLRVATREELPEYPKSKALPHSKKYLLFAVKELYSPVLCEAIVHVRVSDFAKRTPKIAAAIKSFKESVAAKVKSVQQLHALGAVGILAEVLPREVAENAKRLCVSEGALQLDLLSLGSAPYENRARSDKKAKAEKFRVKTAMMAREISYNFMESYGLQNAVVFGLPEVDDRYAIWRVPIITKNKERVGEVVIDAMTTEVDRSRSSTKEVLENRLLGREMSKKISENRESVPHISTLRNTIILGSSESALIDLPEGSVDLVFTSPPYYNARPEYADYFSYEDYLNHMKQVIHECARLLNDGRFFVLNVSPVLIRRASRSEASRRIAVPFDFHRLFIEEGFEFIDDIIWVKPEGAGWATGRGRRFSADRNPCQYKAVPVTEYVLVYRKKTDKLIDWLIRKHPNQDDIRASKIKDGYEVTNLWKITPAHSKLHPAIFPIELASKVIQYYSFRNDVVLDPFGGLGTTGKAAAILGRRFAIVEREERYIEAIKKDIPNWFPVDANPDVNWIGTGSVGLKSYNLFS